MTSVAESKIAYRSLQLEDQRAVLRLMWACGYSPDERFWIWINRQCPHGQSLVELAVSEDGEVIGHYGVLPRLLNLDGVPTKVGMAIHAAVHPDHRGLWILQNLIERIVRRCEEERIPILYGFPNDRIWLVYLKFFQWRPIGDLVALELPLKGWNGGAGTAEEPFRLMHRDSPVFLKAHGEIYQRMICDGLLRDRTCVLKDQGYLTWRYAQHPRVGYRVLEAYSASGGLSGYLVLKRYEKEGTRYGHFVDFGLDPSDERCLSFLVQSALAQFQRQGVDVASCWLLDRIPWVRTLESIGFQRRGFLTHMGYRQIDPQFPVEAFRLDRWHVVMGDSDAF